ncbi:MAG: hypothetical protein LRY71_09090 [Bacillaceae bacterium]|nr:hypothetical protein [Bacillaceae bacterium]
MEQLAKEKVAADLEGKTVRKSDCYSEQISEYCSELIVEALALCQCFYLYFERLV